MSPALSMSCKTILPALLNLRIENFNKNDSSLNIALPFPDYPIKFSTIRELKEIETKNSINGKKIPTYKIPRFKVGDLVKIYWKQRTSPKNSWFCSCCGEKSELCVNDKNEPVGLMSHYDREVFPFPKLITTTKITRVDIIEMRKLPKGSFMALWDSNKYFTDDDYKNVSRDDGFQSASQMFDWFNQHYDLSGGKKFVRYYWG